MSQLWPEGNDKTLLIAVANYLQDCLNNSNTKFDELTQETLQSITESLQVVINPNDDKIPKSSFNLNDLYKQYKQITDDEKSNNKSNNNNKPSLQLPANINERREKFKQFISVLKQHNFFKGCDPGSSEYMNRMEKARLQYNTRFKTMSIDSLSFLNDPINQSNNNNNNNASSSTNQNNNNNNKSQIINSEGNKMKAEVLKGEGNKLLGQKKYQDAINKYNEAIKLNDQNAVYFSNRAAAFTYLRKYNEAVQDARQASEIDPNYVKAYVREGLAEYEMGNYQKAHDAYSKALNKTKATDKNWANYMEKVELCEQKLAANNNNNNNSSNNMDGGGANAANPFAGLGGGGGGGGQPDLGSLLGGLGGMEGLQNLMKNPMMKQMAEQMMQDPEAMKKMAGMMGGGGGGGMPNFGGMGGGGGGGGANDNANANANMGGGGDELQGVMADLMANPEKAQNIFKQAMNDPEVKQMLAADPSLEPLISRVQRGDYTAFMELGQKPEAMAKVKSLIGKYYKK